LVGVEAELEPGTVQAASQSIQVAVEEDPPSVEEKHM
jgi:hypothetical protein